MRDLSRLQAEFEAYCRVEPSRYGLFMVGCGAIGRPLVQAQMIAAYGRQELKARRFPGARPSSDWPRVDVMIAATLGGRHAALWVPIARELHERGWKVGLASFRSRLPADLVCHPVMEDPSWFHFFSIPEHGFGEAYRPLPLWDLMRPSAPWQGGFGVTINLLRAYHQRMSSAWKDVLIRCGAGVP